MFGGLLLFLFPLLGLGLLAIGGLLLIRDRQRLAGLGGLGVGLGGLWTFVLWSAESRCDAFNEVPGQSCTSPTIDGYLVAAVVVLSCGAVATVLALARRAS